MDVDVDVRYDSRAERRIMWTRMLIIPVSVEKSFLSMMKAIGRTVRDLDKPRRCNFKLLTNDEKIELGRIGEI